MVEIELEQVELEKELLDTIAACIDHTLFKHGVKGKVAVVVTGDQEIMEVNQQQRDIASPTDVLSFPAWEGEDAMAPPDGFLGDVMISFETAIRQAEEYGHSLKRELAFLSVHSALHLLGYDHLEEDQEKEMISMQENILCEMGIHR